MKIMIVSFYLDPVGFLLAAVWIGTLCYIWLPDFIQFATKSTSKVAGMSFFPVFRKLIFESFIMILCYLQNLHARANSIYIQYNTVKPNLKESAVLRLKKAKRKTKKIIIIIILWQSEVKSSRPTSTIQDCPSWKLRPRFFAIYRKMAIFRQFFAFWQFFMVFVQFFCNVNVFSAPHWNRLLFFNFKKKINFIF